MFAQTALLQKYGIRVKGDLGQHLLLDNNIVRKITDALKISNGSAVLEIGPGLGALTQELLQRGAQVVAIEKDPKFVHVLEQELLPEFPKTFEVVRADVLECDLKKICKGRDRIQVVSNLPYYITAPILFMLFEGEPIFSAGVFMLQKEAFERVQAQTGAEFYGRLSAVAAASGKAQKLFSVAKGCFTPAPAVDSIVMRFDFQNMKGLTPQNRGRFFEFLKAAFSERRKTLISLLLRQGIGADRQQLESLFQDYKLDLKARAENLSATQLLQLFLRLS